MENDQMKHNDINLWKLGSFEHSVIHNQSYIDRNKSILQWIPIFRKYLESSSEIQTVIHDMVQIMSSQEADMDEKEAALATLVEALK